MLAVSGISAAAKMAHLSHDEAVPKMGHPVLWLDADLGHPPVGSWVLRAYALGRSIWVLLRGTWNR